MLTDLFIFFFPFFLVLTGFNLGVHLNATFCLKELLSLLVISESYPELYIAKRSFQAVLPILLSSVTSLDLLILIFLFSMYLAIQHNDSLMFLESDRKCSNEL